MVSQYEKPGTATFVLEFWSKVDPSLSPALDCALHIRFLTTAAIADTAIL